MSVEGLTEEEKDNFIKFGVLPKRAKSLKDMTWKERKHLLE